ncbi:MAG: 2-C-methyl-D-erythritol 4-phosphate cytidylyltransferase [Oscillospiraceae bacterium]|nr:2-C-methyl-D-erythritol 4-phosphate cytidylyltransferase [Oscillospiraceae bacterium]
MKINPSPLRPFVSAVVVAAGASSRMGMDKLAAVLAGMPVLARTLLAFENSAVIDEIVLVTSEEHLQSYSKICVDYGISKCKKAVIGGDERMKSSLIGACETDPRAKIICIHDGARPLVTEDIISAAVNGAIRFTAAAPAVPVNDTIKRAEDKFVAETPDRSALFAVQTPQCFDADLIKAALTKAVSDSTPCTDDCSAAEAMGVRVRLTQGSRENIKLTTPLDFLTADAILKLREAKEI